MGALGQFVSTPPGGTVVAKLDLRALFYLFGCFVPVLEMENTLRLESTVFS